MSYINGEHSIARDLKLLGLRGKEKVTHKEIRKAHTSAALKSHSDKATGAEAIAEANKKTIEINSAFDRLREKCGPGKILDTKYFRVTEAPDAKPKTPNPNKMSDDEFFGNKDNPEQNGDIDEVLKNNQEDYSKSSGSGSRNSNQQKESNSGSSNKETLSEKATREMKEYFSYKYSKISSSKINEWIKNGADVNAKDSSGFSMLMLAIRQENTIGVKILLENGAKVNYKNRQGDNSLHQAVEEGLLDIIKLLVKNGAKINESTAGLKETVLMRAVITGKVDIVKYLLENNADIDLKDYKGNKAAHYIFYTHNGHRINELFQEAELLKNPTKAMLHAFKSAQEVPIEKLKKLIKAGAKLDAIDDDGNNILILSAAKGNARCVKFLTQDSLVELNAKNKDGDTALRVAANNGHKDIVQRLIDKGADIDAINEKGHTALIGATCQGHLDIVKMLLNEGAKTDITGNDGNNLKKCANISGNQDIIKAINELDKLKAAEKSLVESLKNREEIDIDFVKKILENKNFNIEYKNDEGETALFLASNHHYTDIVNLLINKGANVHALNPEQKTPLMNAACSGQTETIKMLLGSGAKTDITATTGLTIHKCSIISENADVFNLIKEYSNYENSKISSGEALIKAVNQNDKQAVKEIVKEQVHQILSHDHYTKAALDDIKQVFESDHLFQLDTQLLVVQSCLQGLNNGYYDNLESICAMGS